MKVETTQLLQFVGQVPNQIVALPSVQHDAVLRYINVSVAGHARIMVKPCSANNVD